MRRAVIGIDPGLSGAVALLSSGDVNVWDTPTVQRADRREYGVPQMVQLLEVARAGERAPRVVIEGQHPRPKEGVVSAFRSGLGFGVWLGIVHAMALECVIVSPQRWKRWANLLRTDKAASRARALHEFPALADRLARVKDHGRAEAVLLAAYGAAMAPGAVQA